MTIASALDKLNDKLAGSDQQASQTIEGMILRIIDNIDNIGGGGGGGGALILHASGDDFALDKTYAEIAAAAQVGYVGFINQDGDGVPYDVYHLTSFGYDELENGYTVQFGGTLNALFVSATEDGYPAIVE